MQGPGGAAYHCDRYGKRDIHDIGKNLVALMLKNHGFQVDRSGQGCAQRGDCGDGHPASGRDHRPVGADDYHAGDASCDRLCQRAGLQSQNYHRRSGDYPRNMRRRSVRTDIPKDAAEAVKLTQRILGL